MPAKTKAKPVRNRATIRLACWGCLRDDLDGITPAQLRAAIKAGWRDVTREQTAAQAAKVYNDPRDEPPGYSVADWQTHRGTCPECAENLA